MGESIYVRSDGPFLYDLLRKKFYGIKTGYVIGRVTGDLVFFDDTNMSRSHLRITLAGSGLRQALIEDLGSTNGVVLNGTKLKAGQKTALNDGAVLEVGSQILFFTYTQEIPPFSVERNPETITSDPTVTAASGVTPSPAPAAVYAAPASAAAQASAKPGETGQLTTGYTRPTRVRPVDSHTATFRIGDRELKVLDISLTGIGLYRDAAFQWPAVGTKINGRLVAGEHTLDVLIEICKKDPMLVGCGFRSHLPEIKKIMTSYFGIELAAFDMTDLGKTPKCFKGKSCDLQYSLDQGKLGEWHISIFGNRIAADSDGKLRFYSEIAADGQAAKQLVTVLLEALRLLANIDGLDEDVRDSMGTLILTTLQRP